MRRFLICSAGNKNLNGKIGELVGEVDYLGCRSGWHTLRLADGTTAMFTGEEISEIKKENNMRGDIESGKCDICGAVGVVSRKYYHYNTTCECCRGGKHFEIVFHCHGCVPKPPKRISAVIKPECE